MSILITGVAGFIGSSLAIKLLKQGKQIIGIDNLNAYYDIELKKNRLQHCLAYPSFQFFKSDIIDRSAIAQLFSQHQFETVIHMAAQPGVRYSVENPYVYIDSNIVGFLNILEGCRQTKVKHFIFASSSSVYGGNTKLPFSECDSVDHPVSLYGATKKANELMAHSYAHLYELPCTGLRFFTVYGPWGRPDMALFKFTRHILEGKTIAVYNNGKMLRDFTYVDDIIDGVIRIIDHIPKSHPSQTKLHPGISFAPYRIYNIGNHCPVELNEYIKLLEKALGRSAKIEMMPMQAGDVLNTYADINHIEETIGPLPHTPVEIGISRFVEWYKHYYAYETV